MKGAGELEEKQNEINLEAKNKMHQNGSTINTSQGYRLTPLFLWSLALKFKG